MHILISRPIEPQAVALLQARPGLTVEVLHDQSQTAFDERLPQADVAVLAYRTLRRAQITQLPRLKLVVRHGVGFDSVDVEALTERGIPLFITPGANTVSVAEHALALLLAVARRIPQAHAQVRSGRWQSPLGAEVGPAGPMPELAGRQALLVGGAGRIGQRFAQMLLALDVRVQIWDPPAPDNLTLPTGVERVHDLKAAVQQADIVSLHAPCDEASRHSIDPRTFKAGALLVNTARGALVHSGWLLEALQSGRLRGAGLDVFEDEPMPADHPLAAHPAVVLSPHHAAHTDGALLRMGMACAHHILDWMDGTPDRAALVHPQVLDAPIEQRAP